MQDDSGRTLLDGVWWPRSVDPAVELPGLVLAMQAQGPSDERVDGPVDAREVLLSWFGDLPAGLLTPRSMPTAAVDLLTVPASADDAVARAALETAARP